MTKICKKCNRELPLAMFSKHPKSKDRLQGSCKECARKWYKSWRIRPEVAKRLKEQQKRWAKCNVDNRRLNRKKHSLKVNFGISIEDYNELLLKQNGVCAICGGNTSRSLAVDHNHETGKIRGLLCGNCNTALGLLKDDKTVIVSLLRYLDDNS